MENIEGMAINDSSSDVKISKVSKLQSINKFQGKHRKESKLISCKLTALAIQMIIWKMCVFRIFKQGRNPYQVK